MTDDRTLARSEAIRAIQEERLHQMTRWAPDHFETIGPWQALAVLTEALGAIAASLNDGEEVSHLRNEIIQLAACCLACLEVL